MLVAAKWRDFTNINPNTEQEPESVAEESYSRKPGRSRTSKDSSKVIPVSSFILSANFLF
jgi:hypothetical protein